MMGNYGAPTSRYETLTSLSAKVDVLFLFHSFNNAHPQFLARKTNNFDRRVHIPANVADRFAVTLY